MEFCHKDNLNLSLQRCIEKKRLSQCRLKIQCAAQTLFKTAFNNIKKSGPGETTATKWANARLAKRVKFINILVLFLR